MKTKIIITIQIDDETTILSEKKENANYSDIEEMLTETYIRAEEHIDSKRFDYNSD